MIRVWFKIKYGFSEVDDKTINTIKISLGFKDKPTHTINKKGKAKPNRDAQKEALIFYFSKI